jgi:prefoldin subunit 5
MYELANKIEELAKQLREAELVIEDRLRYIQQLEQRIQVLQQDEVPYDKNTL